MVVQTASRGIIPVKTILGYFNKHNHNIKKSPSFQKLNNLLTITNNIQLQVDFLIKSESGKLKRFP